MEIGERCRKRKVENRCVYVDAPMTRNFEDIIPRARPAGAVRRPSKKVITEEEKTQIEKRQIEEEERRREERRDSEYSKPAPESGPFIKSGGFFGELCVLL